MSTAARRLGWTGAGVAVLVLAIAGAMAWLFDPNAYRSRVESLVEAQTGRPLSITGDVSLSFFPVPGVNVGRTVWRNPPEFGATPFAEFDAMSVRVRPWALLRGTVAADTVVIEGLNVRLVRSASGRHNFDDLLARGNRPAGSAPAGLALGGLLLKGASLGYEDRQSGERLQITHLDLRTGAWSADAPLPVAARFRFSDPVRNMAGDAAMETEIWMELSRQRVSAQSLHLTTALSAPAVVAHELKLNLQADLRYDMAGKSVSVDDVRMSSSIPGVDDAPVRLSVPRAALDLASQTVSLARFDLTALDLDIHGRLAAVLGTRPSFSGRVQVMPFSPRRLLSALGRPLPDAAGAGRFRHARLEAAVSGDAQGVALESIDAWVDDVRLNGRIEAGFAAGWPVTLALGIDAPAVRPGDRLQLTLHGRGRRLEDPGSYQADGLALVFGPLTVRGSLKLEAQGEKSRFAGALELPPFDARALLARLGQRVPETEDPRAFTRVRARVEFAGTGQSVQLHPVKLDLDDTHLEGTLNVSQFGAPERAVTFDLRADALDLVRYLPPKAATSTQGAFAGYPAAAPPLDRLRGLELDGRIHLGTLIIGDVTLNDLTLAARSRNGRLEVGSASASSTATPGDHIAASWPLILPAP